MRGDMNIPDQHPALASPSNCSVAFMTAEAIACERQAGHDGQGKE
jgi:hypothetical protein